MNAVYRIDIKRSALKELQWLPRHIQRHIIKTIDALEHNPHPFGSKKLTGSSDRWRLRVGSYRILYTVDATAQHISIYRIVHRKDAYK